MNTKKITSESQERERYVEDLVKTVQADFEKRRKERLSYERQWELNMNFLNGNQYCDLTKKGEIIENGRDFYWQNRSVFNHIAPIIDTRLSKFSSIKPTIAVRPQTDDDVDVASASLAEKLIENAFKVTNLYDVVKKVTVWSESCGTGFYKVVWDVNGGNKVGTADGKDVFEGEVSILPVSPFEIFPDNLNAEEIEDCESIIHARVMTAKKVLEKYGVKVKGAKIDVLSMTKNERPSSMGEDENVIEDAVVVIEKYERPSKQFPCGRLITVAEDKLLYVGDLPYKNGEKYSYSFPFVKQTAFSVAGSFFGGSVIERLIPVQRAFNAVKNRKHEFLNRLSMGVMTVEDGSVDVDDLAEDGLSPGKVLVYRQGAKAPELMSETTMPTEFNQEEDKLINEFVIISGVSDVSSSQTNASIKSGSALEILIEQDNTRLIMAAEVIRGCYTQISKQIIRLYSQFSAGVRAIKHQDEFNKTRIYYADARSLSSDDVYIVNENELLYTARQKKEMIFELYESGLLTDDEGKLRPSTKEKVLSLLGYKELDYQKGLARLQEDKAQNENDILTKKDATVDEIDDHSIHVDEHTRYVLSEYPSLKEEQKQRFYAHIKAHKQKILEQKTNGEL